MSILLTLALAASSPCIAIDGDTIRCGKENIRILGIDSPEMPDHCRVGRICAPGDPVAAKESLRVLMQGRVTVRRHGKDLYRRTLAHVYSNGKLVACTQLRTGNAIYKPSWDNKPKGFVGRRCRLVK